MDPSKIIKLNTIVFSLFGILSITNILFSKSTYPRDDLYMSFIINDYINVGLCFVFLFFRKLDEQYRPFLKGIYVSIVYFVIPSLIITGFKLRIVLPISIVLFCIYMLLILNRNNSKFGKLFNISSKILMGYGIVIIPFGLIYFGRALNTLLEVNSLRLIKSSEIRSISDICASMFWVIGGILGVMKSEKGKMMICGIVTNGVILYSTLVLFMIINPVVNQAQFGITYVVLIFLMSILFIIPFINLLTYYKKKMI
jgi:hypothetical protein